MIGKKILFPLLALCFLLTNSIGQNTIGKYPYLGVGAGVLVFSGNIGKGNDLSSYSRIRTGYNITLEQRFGKIFGVAITGLFGKLAQNERSSTIENNRNFETSIYQGDLSVMIHSDKLFPDAGLTPYLGVGIGYLAFNPYGDLRDKDGKKYYYWSDGGIYDLPKTPTNIPLAKQLQRDYTYETKLDSLNSYSHNTLVVPLTFGFSLQVSDNFKAAVGASYFLTFTNHIDNVNVGKNNSYLYTNVSLTYAFGHPDRGTEIKRYENVDFAKIDDGDSDGDGVRDSKDKCAGTPTGVKVGSDGCPEDSDKDGVPDYQDKEPNSKKGALVDATGISLTDEMLAKKQAEWEASGSERSEAFNANPSATAINQIEKQAQEIRTQSGAKKTLPADFQPADYNKDGFIQVNEINKVIDGFFSGENDFTVEKINRLIDFFFEQ